MFTAQVFWIAGPWPGRLGIVPRPRGGDWLEDEVRAWRAAGIDVVVSLLMPDEIEELDLEAEGDRCGQHEIRFFSFPVIDQGVPDSLEAVSSLVLELTRCLDVGESVVVHCRQSIGRSAIIAALLLVSAGESADQAFSRIERSRGRPVPDTEEQRAWVKERT
jgi:protein-tyrosine phosphatase